MHQMPLELELETVVGQPVWMLGTKWNLDPLQQQYVLLTNKPSLPASLLWFLLSTNSEIFSSLLMAH